MVIFYGGYALPYTSLFISLFALLNLLSMAPEANIYHFNIQHIDFQLLLTEWSCGIT